MELKLVPLLGLAFLRLPTIMCRMNTRTVEGFVLMYALLSNSVSLAHPHLLLLHYSTWGTFRLVFILAGALFYGTVSFQKKLVSKYTVP
jgi:hypothetical protein